jgi:hypothetical protein
MRFGEVYPSSQTYIGYLDEIRISKGIARWWENFTPPKAPYDTHSIAGNFNDGGQILIVDENNWEVRVASDSFSTGNYEMDTASGTQMVIARNVHGEIIGYGNVNSVN